MESVINLPSKAFQTVADVWDVKDGEHGGGEAGPPGHRSQQRRHEPQPRSRGLLRGGLGPHLPAQHQGRLPVCPGKACRCIPPPDEAFSVGHISFGFRLAQRLIAVKYRKS